MESLFTSSNSGNYVGGHYKRNPMSLVLRSLTAGSLISSGSIRVEHIKL